MRVGHSRRPLCSTPVITASIVCYLAGSRVVRLQCKQGWHRVLYCSESQCFTQTTQRMFIMLIRPCPDTAYGPDQQVQQGESEPLWPPSKTMLII